MIAISTHKDTINTGSEMPNFVIWSWMRTALQLSGSNLMLFAYIYSQSFDASHYVTTSLSCLAEWFGITRQTLSRNIDKLPYIIKDNSCDHPAGFYNCCLYRVDMDAMLHDFSNGPDETYQEFLASYERLLILKFPDDKKTIEAYFKLFSEWHAGLSVEMRKQIKPFITLGNKIKENEEVDYEDVNFSDALQDMKEQVEKLSSDLDKFLNGESKSNVEITSKISNPTVNTKPCVQGTSVPQSNSSKPTPKPKHKGAKRPSDLGIVAKPQKPKSKTKEEKERIKQEQFNLLIQQLYAENVDFIVRHNIRDERILSSLNDYVSEVIEGGKNSRGVTTHRYKMALDQLALVMSPDKMLMYIQNAIIGGYSKFVYDLDKIQSDNRMLLERSNIWEKTENFISNFPDASEEFVNTVNRYVEDCVLASDRYSALQFEHRLNDLLKRNLTSEQVLTVICDTLSSGWKQWNFTNVQNVATNVSSTPTPDMEDKENATDTFFRKHYFYQTPEIKQVLLDYLHQTSHGRNMSCNKWVQEMEYLLLHRHTNDEIIMAIKDATLHDYEHLCTVDYAADKRMQHTFGTLEDAVVMRDRTRRKHCEQERKNNPNDPRFEGMPEDYFDELAKQKAGKPAAAFNRS